MNHYLLSNFGGVGLGFEPKSTPTRFASAPPVTIKPLIKNKPAKNRFIRITAEKFMNNRSVNIPKQ
jgi:hypothetical protein